MTGGYGAGGVEDNADGQAMPSSSDPYMHPAIESYDPNEVRNPNPNPNPNPKSNPNPLRLRPLHAPGHRKL